MENQVLLTLGPFGSLVLMGSVFKHIQNGIIGNKLNLRRIVGMIHLKYLNVRIDI